MSAFDAMTDAAKAVWGAIFIAALSVAGTALMLDSFGVLFR